MICIQAPGLFNALIEILNLDRVRGTLFDFETLFEFQAFGSCLTKDCSI